MQALRSYIVRVYRQGARTLTGVVEDPRSGVSRAFETMEDLWALLRERSLRRERPKREIKRP